jgi:transcriptional antiterminator RfaH
MQLDSEDWHVVQIKPNGFQLAQLHLLRQGFTCFCPTHLERRHLAQQKKNNQVVRPLFPGYLFVQFSADQPGWQSINSTRGVSRLLLQGQNKLQALPSPFIAGLLARCDEAGMLIETEDFKPGDRVRLLSGPFADFVTTVESFESQERIRVLFDLMGRETRVSVPVGSVARSQ